MGGSHDTDVKPWAPPATSASVTSSIDTGHEHMYERFALMNGNGDADPEHGSRLFVVGTGGGELVAATRVAADSEVRLVSFGVQKLTLSTHSYSWEFIRPGGGTADMGADIATRSSSVRPARW